ncbi:3-deoxy-D-manno-octulosonic acid transferase [Oceaniglobus trochenteri]|uniref:3-deoxy-D-manno-octulosonic acid transferase n=1 Tax=Oceaniglobus trochenteri TaxID=2763260 RepID=UPI001CFFC1C8|nr:glycosyltransferase N-terminal domain-containing protein [Oceaniglobus trochenteri]
MLTRWRQRLQARAAAIGLSRAAPEPADTPLPEGLQGAAQPVPPRPQGEVLWVHLGQGGDPMALALLITRLREDRGPMAVIATSDVAIPAADVIAQPPPEDTDRATQDFLDHWRPDACLWAGGGWLPVLLSQTAKRRIPAICVDCRIGENHPRPRRWKSALGRGDLIWFDRILTGSQKDAARLISLGARAEQVETAGWMESSAGALPCDESEWAHLGQTLEARPLWLAVDVPKAEFTAIAEAHHRASRLSHRLLLILVPSDPATGPDLRARLESEGWRTALRSNGEEPTEDTQIYLADSPGELGLWYRLAAITYMGNTLSGAGAGRPPSEPAALGSVVVHGPRTAGHRQAYARLRNASAQCEIDSAIALGVTIERLLAPDQAAALASAAWAEVTAGAEASDQALSLVNAALNGEME